MVIIQPALNLFPSALFPKRRLTSHWYSPRRVHAATKGNIYIHVSKNTTWEKPDERKGREVTNEEREREREEEARQKSAALDICWVSFLNTNKPSSCLFFLDFCVHCWKAVFFWVEGEQWLTVCSVGVLRLMRNSVVKIFPMQAIFFIYADTVATKCPLNSEKFVFLPCSCLMLH